MKKSQKLIVLVGLFAALGAAVGVAVYLSRKQTSSSSTPSGDGGSTDGGGGSTDGGDGGSTDGGGGGSTTTGPLDSFLGKTVTLYNPQNSAYICTVAAAGAVNNAYASRTEKTLYTVMASTTVAGTYMFKDPSGNYLSGTPEGLLQSSPSHSTWESWTPVLATVASGANIYNLKSLHGYWVTVSDDGKTVQARKQNTPDTWEAILISQ